MTCLSFDTLRFANRLKAAGVPPAQAEAEASALAEALESSQVVTRQDLQLELAPIRSDLALLKWMLGVVVAGVLALMLKAFF